PGRRTRLLREYGTLKALRAATRDELLALPWLPDAVAIAVFDHLHTVGRPASSVRRRSADEGRGEVVGVAGVAAPAAETPYRPPQQSTDAADGEDESGG